MDARNHFGLDITQLPRLRRSRFRAQLAITPAAENVRCSASHGKNGLSPSDTALSFRNTIKSSEFIFHLPKNCRRTGREGDARRHGATWNARVCCVFGFPPSAKAIAFHLTAGGKSIAFAKSINFSSSNKRNARRISLHHHNFIPFNAFSPISHFRS